MTYSALHGMPLHELLQRGKAQGLWPIPSDLSSLSTEDILKVMAERTGHRIKYIRQVFKAGSTLAPHEWPSLYQEGTRIKTDLHMVGKARYKNKPNPLKRAAIVEALAIRRERISHNVRTAAPAKPAKVRTNATQLERVKDHAPLLTNGKMRKSSKNTTAYSTGFAPPSRKDETRSIDGKPVKGKVIPKPQKRFRKD